MTKNVQLTLTGTQYNDDGEKTVTELSFEAEYYFRNGSHYIFYEEASEDTGEIVKNTIKLKDNTLEQQKKGAVSSHLIFEPRKEHMIQYMTPLGSLTLGVLTQSLETTLSESEISISAEYLLTAENSTISRNTIAIMVCSK